MEDQKIVELYWARSEEALAQASGKYGRYCHTIAYNILYDDPDSEECVNDTWLRSWGAIPPARPFSLKAFLGKITRNLALDRREASGAKKRGGGEADAVLDELSECIEDPSAGGHDFEDIELTEILNAFLEGLEPQKRRLFLRRYWYFDSVKEIADSSGLSESNVKTSLMRMREKLRDHLAKEGIRI